VSRSPAAQDEDGTAGAAVVYVFDPADLDTWEIDGTVSS
jgi:hypothetical protein